MSETSKTIEYPVECRNCGVCRTHRLTLLAHKREEIKFHCLNCGNDTEIHLSYTPPKLSDLAADK